MKKRSLVYFILSALLILSITSCIKDPNGDTPKCEHKNTEESAKKPTCLEDGLWFVKCLDCNEIVESDVIFKKAHKLERVEEECTEYSCTKAGVIIELCRECNSKITTSVGGTHLTPSNTTGYNYFKDKTDMNATFYKSCSTCKEALDETFTASIYSAQLYAPTSPTVTLYETESELAYGFRWNTKAKPLAPVIAIKKVQDTSWTYHAAENDTAGADVYYCRGALTLEAGAEYEYKLADYVAGTESEVFSFTALDPSVESFSFASLGDSQNAAEDGKYLNRIFCAMGDVDFLIHSGDICEDSRVEESWTNMLDTNREYFGKLPTMTASGNHETTYKGGTDTQNRHFYNNKPEQGSTDIGYYYSFTYGNTKFIVLNTNMGDHYSGAYSLPKAQYDWLVSELQSNTCRWTVVTMHCPMYSVGKYGSSANTNGTSLALRAQLGDLFAQYGVDIVIQGHDHALSKTYPIGEGSTVMQGTQQTVGGITYDVDPAGPIYIMTGPAGNQWRAPVDGYEAEFYEEVQTGTEASWAEYTVTEDSITVTVKSAAEDGTVTTLYSWGILRSA